MAQSKSERELTTLCITGCEAEPEPRVVCVARLLPVVLQNQSSVVAGTSSMHYVVNTRSATLRYTRKLTFSWEIQDETSEGHLPVLM